jgi:hypothetical protein
MLSATDSFIQYLSDELNGTVPVHWRRQTVVDESAGLLKLNHLNVQGLGFFEDDSLEYCLVSLDLLGDDERTVAAQLKAIRDVLILEQIIPELDYTIPASPISTGRSVSWEGRAIRFLSVRTPKGQRYVHYNATFPLTHSRD